MTIKRDPREGISSEPELSSDNPSFAALHYALAAKVDALSTRQTECANNLAAVASEARTPKPLPWGALATVVAAIFAVFGTVGGLVHSSLSDRIAQNSKSIAETDIRLQKRDETLMPRTEIEASIKLLQDTARRLEEVQIALNVTKAEFNATILAIRERQTRNESYIEEARKAEAVHTRINQIYDLYRQLQGQAHDQLQQLASQQRNGK